MIKTALITGGNKGIGLELTREFLALEYKVIVVARDFNGFEFTDKVECIVYDLYNVEDIPKLVASMGQIDILINTQELCTRYHTTTTQQKKSQVC